VFSGTNCGTMASITKTLPGGATGITVPEPKVGDRDEAGGGAIAAFCEYDGTGNSGWGAIGHHNLSQAVKRWVWVIGPPAIKIPVTGRYAFEWSVSASTTVAVFAYDPKNQTPLVVKLAGPPKATGVEVQVVDAANTPQDGVVTIIALATTGEP
jgi:hypothetical protein